MANSTTEIPQSEAIDRIWELAESIGVCMFISWDGERQRARPLMAMPRRGEDAIYFLTDVGGAKDEQIERFPKVSLAFADKDANHYVVITGRGTVSNDRARIKALWSPMNRAWWDSAEDPAIRLITVRPEDAELWDSPGRLLSTAVMIGAAVTGKEPALGDNAKVEL